MDNHLLTSGHQRKATKKTKTKKSSKPIKVVYISNPMKVKADSASQFRALVQELTGQDSELPDPSKFPGTDDHFGGQYQMVQDVPDPVMKVGDDDHSPEVPVLLDPGLEDQPTQFEPFEDVFTPQMIDNMSGLLPTSVLYESPQVDVLRRLDAV
ncbi:hypothetical protein CIPAW_10G040200 [Carya illinoinensis]|uniref:VQ domain-containing protein n=1 Tax=Carya illinoinensis TaxID=32201 RepID=A0A8T1PB55_CARIL|nr:hypothetical protein CIPAW_10G040200 [Carya illinoinensis]KAG6690953.1 hypothetical protein I3842_10G039600 [Carya illinoinensis]